MTEPLSARQLLALSYRAKRSQDSASDQARGVSDTVQWLADLLRTHATQPDGLRQVLQARIARGIRWDVSEYGDGRAAVLDDIAGILANDSDTINDIIEYGRDRRRAEKETQL